MVISPRVKREEKKTSLFRIDVTKRTRANIIVQARIIPNANVYTNFDFLECSESVLVTAVLLTNPPIAPVSPIPFLAPTVLIKTYPAVESAQTKTTISQILNGLKTCVAERRCCTEGNKLIMSWSTGISRGEYALLGSNGKMTAEIIPNFNPA